MSAATAADTTEVAQTRVVKDTYLDSLRLLVATSAMSMVSDVFWAGAVMATPAGRETLAAKGFGGDVLAGLGSNELVLAVLAADDESASTALDAGAEAAFAEEEAGDVPQRSAPRTLTRAAAQLPDANVAIVSVAGDYAALEAHHALTCGMHVLLFSDNVPIEEEAELKDRANSLGLLVMGPGAGTAILSGTGLGFANQVRRGPVGRGRGGRHRSTGSVGAARPVGRRGLACRSGSAGGTCPRTSAAGWPRPRCAPSRPTPRHRRSCSCPNRRTRSWRARSSPNVRPRPRWPPSSGSASWTASARSTSPGRSRQGALTAARLAGTTPATPSTGRSARVVRCLPGIDPDARGPSAGTSPAAPCATRPS